MTISLNSDKTINVPYTGVRTSYFVFHPKLFPNLETRWLDVQAAFLKQLNTWYEVVTLYQEDMVLSEQVTTKQLKKEIEKVVNEISRDHDKNVYLLEAVAEALWDKPNHDEEDYDKVGKKVERHELPPMKDLYRRAGELRSLDLGLRLPEDSPLISRPIRHTWSG